MIRLEGVGKQYANTPRPILDNVSAEFLPGAVSVIVGPSGCGKSTLFHCILQLEAADRGKIFIQDAPVQPGHKADSLGAVLQGASLFQHLNVMDNITLAPRVVLGQSPVQAEKTALKLLQQLQLEEKAQAFPHQLSGGEIQRVSIARALATHPKILLLDEPTTALDKHLAEDLIPLLKSLAAQGMTVVLSTHDLDFARKVGDVFFALSHGALQPVAASDLAQLMTPGVS